MDELDTRDPTQIGPYELLGSLGSGGMGRVYLGRDADGERVAVKVIHSDLARDPEFHRRFQREIEALRAVSGPGIAAILDADAEAPRPWLATEYVEGPSLHHVVTRGTGPLDAAAVCSLGAALARTLAAVHAAQLVHRDIKPTNLLLTAEGPKLIDFGIARDLAASTITRTGLAVGTPQFMAPEQLESGRRTGTAADVFALAGLLVFAATGVGPFGEGTPAQLLYAVVHSEPELGAVPAELRPLLSRCLDKDPAKRPTAMRVAQELEHPAGFVDPEATVQLGDGPRGRRVRRTALVGAGALAAVVVAAVMLMDGNASGSNTSDHSPKSGAFPAGNGTTSSADSIGGPPTGASGTKPLSGSPVSALLSGSVSGTPAGSSEPSGVPSSSGTVGGPGPSTSTQLAGTHSSSVPANAPSHTSAPPTRTTPPPSHASSAPAGGSAPAAVTAVAVHPNSQDGSTMAVSWNADPGAINYVVKYYEEYVPNQPTSVTATSTSTSIKVTPYQPYCIQVQAVNTYGASDWSPASPVCVQATPGG